MTDVREERPAALLATGKFVGDGKRLDPNVPFSREFIFFVPRHRYQLLRFRAQLLSIPASVRLSRRAYPDYQIYRRDHNVYGFWHVVDDSWLHDLLYGRDRQVVIRYDLVNPTVQPWPPPPMSCRSEHGSPTRPGANESRANHSSIGSSPNRISPIPASRSPPRNCHSKTSPSQPPGPSICREGN